MIVCVSNHASDSINPHLTTCAGWSALASGLGTLLNATADVVNKIVQEDGEEPLKLYNKNGAGSGACVPRRIYWLMYACFLPSGSSS